MLNIAHLNFLETNAVELTSNYYTVCSSQLVNFLVIWSKVKKYSFSKLHWKIVLRYMTTMYAII